MKFQDAATLPDGQIETDIAIIGAGAAGMALAVELARASRRVLLVEGGDVVHRHRSQLLYLGRNIGRRNFSPVFSRMRRFGGSTTRWGGQCRPFDEEDFAALDHVPGSGWPVDAAAMRPWYARAQAFCQLGPFDYEPASWLGDGAPSLAMEGSALACRIYQFSHPADLRLVHGPVIEASPHVQVLTNASLVALHTEAGGTRVTQLDLAGARGARLRVRPRHVVLACGGIENARLLLACAPAHPRGLGNDHDLVGRYFMDHPYVFPGYVAQPSAALAPLVIEGYEQVGSVQRFHAALALSGATRREQRLNGASMYLVRRPRHKALGAYLSPGGVALNRVIEVLQHREGTDGRLLRDIGTLLTAAPDVLRAGWGRVRALARPDAVMALRICLETTPVRDSRVLLARDRDRHGVPRVRVDWRLAPADLAGYEALMQALREELPARGLGHVVEHGLRDADGWPAGMTGGKHHMGTTRMHPDPARGVVDTEGRVHGVANLHVAGSSVFPTGGYANPTLTIVALAMRLADRLRALE